MSTGEKAQQGTSSPKGVLKCISINFLTQLIEKVMRERALLDLMLIDNEGLVWDVKTGAAETAGIMRWWSSGSCKKGGGLKTESQCCPSGEQTSAY